MVCSLCKESWAVSCANTVQCSECLALRWSKACQVAYRVVSVNAIECIIREPGPFAAASSSRLYLGGFLHAANHAGGERQCVC